MSSKPVPSLPAPDGAVRKPKRGMLIAGGGIGLLLIVVVGLWLSGLFGHGKPRRASAAADQRPVYVETPEMITNLDAGPHRITFAKVQCRIEVAHASDAAALTGAMPRVVDMVQTYLRETRPEELRSDVGTYRLHEALLLRAGIAAPDAHVTDVLFEELIVQ